MAIADGSTTATRLRHVQQRGCELASGLFFNLTHFFDALGFCCLFQLLWHMRMAFYPNCTLPAGKVVYVAAPGVRSTLDILWPSLATLIACTYQVLHLSVPEQRLGRDKGFKGDLKWTFRRFCKGLKWACVNLLAPELVLCKAVSDWFGAREQLRALHNNFPATKETWTMTHMLFADMGGFVVGYTPGEHPGDDAKQPSSEHTVDSEHQVNKDILNTGDKPTALTDSSATKVWHFRAASLRTAIEHGYLPQDLATKDEIMDKSKNDAFTKVVAMGQIGYYVVAIVTRAIRGLPVSPMELGVTAFVVCSLATYIASFPKPKGVTEAIKVGAFKRNIPEWLRNIELERDSFFGLSGPLQGEQSSNIEVAEKDMSYLPLEMGTLLPICALFGAIHLAGWNLEFSTTIVDIWLWRTAAIVSTVAYPCFMGIASLCYLLHESLTREVQENLVLRLGIILGLLYALSRLVIIAEMFRCLFYLPPRAFVATWTANIPHIG